MYLAIFHKKLDKKYEVMYNYSNTAVFLCGVALISSGE